MQRLFFFLLPAVLAFGGCSSEAAVDESAEADKADRVGEEALLRIRLFQPRNTCGKLETIIVKHNHVDEMELSTIFFKDPFVKESVCFEGSKRNIKNLLHEAEDHQNELAADSPIDDITYFFI